MKSRYVHRVSALGRTVCATAGAAPRALVLALALSTGFVATMAQPGVAQAQQSNRIGFVGTDRILGESGIAKSAENRLESEFKRRDQELQNLANNLRSQVQKFEKDAPVLSESDRIKRQRDLADLDSELQRKRRDFQEDYNRRRNEEFSGIVTKANDAIKRIAEQESYDLIIQDAVTVNPRIDITDKVIQSLGK